MTSNNTSLSRDSVESSAVDGGKDQSKLLHQSNLKEENEPSLAVENEGKHKKRTAERQIIKGEDETTDEINETNLLESGTFSKASLEALQGRRIVKATRHSHPPPTIEPTEKQPQKLLTKLEEKKDDKITNPFAKSGFGKFSAVNPFQIPLTNNTSFSFGTADSLGATGTGSSAFGSAAAMKTSGFGSIISSSTAATTTAGFASFAAPKKDEPNQQKGEDEENVDNGDSHSGHEGHEPEQNAAFIPTQIFSLPPETEEANGEENEKCILQLRAKLYSLVDHSSAQSLQQQENDKNQDDNNANNDKNSEPPLSKIEQHQSIANRSWKEVGIGPVRILQQRRPLQDLEEKRQSETTTNTRIVQRRESTPGGMGTKLILNIPIRRETVVHRQGDKHILVSTFAYEKASASESYLFKVKTIDDANNLFHRLEEAISNAAETPSIK
mmetsp:Transcript_14051/g.20125  ORF Transcript_14051/g.20125 Transcript_14051/m.20125 type:complete len:441 (+) Transcript_14051:92-1414(+)|eukprot:CAMPEP_0172437342 /NCGR_PEP_ID=MMETSP1064-20121228/72203_1 /TAXON_ID=202472 /ORGANISM="Aulacoseira subarctica , Strain CCAP 1002/5" /LENGTH=440 /DNA_ID=CAMNT_0013185801 /DNA_START=43 /DNA_END=1365 /DNA_ORIENTATION=+